MNFDSYSDYQGQSSDEINLYAGVNVYFIKLNEVFFWKEKL